jgi:PAS domain S-box-containing protein
VGPSPSNVLQAAPAIPAAQVQALRRVALAVAHPGGPDLFEELVRELAASLGADCVFVAVFADDSRSTMRTLAIWLDGKLLRNFDYPLEGSPCATVVGRCFQYVASDLYLQFAPDKLFAARGIDSLAAFPLNDSGGAPLGLLVAMGREPVAGGDADHAEAMLKIIATRLTAEIERGRTDEALRAVALAVSSSRGETVFDELVRLLATILHVEVAFIARHDSADPKGLRILAMYYDGQILRDIRYALAGTPCETVLGQQFRAYPAQLREQFPADQDARTQCTESYAGHPLTALDGSPLGVVSVASRRPLAQLERVEAMLKIFAMRAAAEVERLGASEALRRSEASYRAVFEASEDAIFVHDWDTGKLLDVNAKGCAAYGYGREELRRTPIDKLTSGLQAFTAEDAMRYFNLAKLGRCPPFEWHRRHKDGSLHWDEVHMKPALIDGRPQMLSFSREVTAQKQALEDLRVREEQYRQIFETSLDGLFLWDENLRIVDVNPAGLALYGYRREQMVGQSYPPNMPSTYIQERLQFVRDALAGKTTHLETTVLRPDGTTFEADLRVMPFVHRGQPHALAALRDISERRRRERELRDSEAQYRAIFNASADALVLRDAQFRIVDVNATYESMSGYTRDEVLGLDRVLANPAQLGATIRALHEQALRGTPIQLETQFLRRDGGHYELELRGVPILHRGQPHVLYIGRDITQSRRADEALRDSEAQYRAIFNASADALVLRDADFRIVEVNPAYLAMSGYTRDEAVGITGVLTQPAGEYEACMTVHAHVLGGEQLRLETVETRKDGSTFVSEVRGMPVVYRGRPHVLYVTRDITERRHAEAERAELEHRLRQAQKMEAIGQLTGGLAHDFNNILTSVIGYVAMAQERPAAQQDPALARPPGQARLAGERARDHVAQLLAFSRPRRGERRLLAAAPVSRHALQLLRSTLPTSIAVECDEPDPTVPPVLGDPVQLEQVLFNLCINARDAIHDHGEIRVRVGHSEPAGGHCASCGAGIEGTRWVWVEVCDDGDGMTPEVVEHMFEPFFTTKEVGRGTGMGLAMVHGIVHDHGGHLEVRSAPGQGSMFRILLPAAPPGDWKPEPAATHASSPGAAAPALHGRALLVEDDPIVSGYMVDLLTGWGLEVVLEHDPLRAARRFTDGQDNFDLLLTDQTMPGMTGLALARHASSHRPSLPILLYTGNDSDVAPDELARCGVRSLLRKPLSDKALRALLQDLLAVPAIERS